ncbi:hypothetical protein GCM10009001_26100 [Virgibacillus siamensis]|uniref:HTH cro/C1-type domain-containing protein n=1 Tax=Virgibacillus siamensis TaxID=480071 RepID=A0ABN1GAN4_9BACI
MQDNFGKWLTSVIGEDEMRELDKKATFRAQMIKARHNLKLSQQDLADKIGVAKSTIGRIEAGNISPKVSTLQKIADALNVCFVIDGIQRDDRDYLIKS